MKRGEDLMAVKGGDLYEKAALWESRGRLLWMRGDLEEAKAAFEKALHWQHNRTSSRCWLAKLEAREQEGWRGYC